MPVSQCLVTPLNGKEIRKMKKANNQPKPRKNNKKNQPPKTKLTPWKDFFSPLFKELIIVNKNTMW